MKYWIFALLILVGCSQEELITPEPQQTVEELVPGQYERFFLEVDILKSGRIEFESYGVGQYHRDLGTWEMISDSTFTVSKTDAFNGDYHVICIDDAKIQMMTPRGFKEWFRTL